MNLYGSHSSSLPQKLVNVPKLDTYLSRKYAPDFQGYQQRTKRLIPYLY